MGKERKVTPLGERLRRKRIDTGLTQTAVAEKIGVFQVTVSNWETGKTTPNDEDLNKLSSIIGKVYRPQSKLEQKNEAENLDENQALDELQSDESPYSIWLRVTRQKKDLSVPELAAKAEVTPATIYAIEAGKISNPQIGTQRKIAKALGEKASDEVADETKKDAEIKGVGQLIGFNPHDDDELPVSTIGALNQNFCERPLYVGEGGNIRNRIKDHAQKFWFKAPIVDTGAYIRIDDVELRKKVETLLIKFLKSNAVLNKQNVER